MPSNHRDAGYLWDMLQAARRLQEFTDNLSYEAYLESVLIQSAVERQLEILGEAARRMSEAFRQEHPEIPSDTFGDSDAIEMEISDLAIARFKLHIQIGSYIKVGTSLQRNSYIHCPEFQWEFTGKELLEQSECLNPPLPIQKDPFPVQRMR